jgi:hypothetical protein
MKRCASRSLQENFHKFPSIVDYYEHLSDNALVMESKENENL